MLRGVVTTGTDSHVCAGTVWKAGPSYVLTSSECTLFSLRCFFFSPSSIVCTSLFVGFLLLYVLSFRFMLSSLLLITTTAAFGVLFNVHNSSGTHRATKTVEITRDGEPLRSYDRKWFYALDSFLLDAF
jgi:hypothetical protein